MWPGPGGGGYGLNDPSVAIPLHFSLEFIGVAAFGGIAAWAVQRRLWLHGAGAFALLVSQVIHTGQFLVGEDAAVVLALRLGGLVTLLAAIHIEGRRTDPDVRDALQVVAAPAAGAIAWATAAGAAALALGHRRIEDRSLWAAAWAAVAGGELWLAAIDAGTLVLARDLGPHLLRAAGLVLVGTWVWRRTGSSLQLRVVAAFTLVLFVIVVVAGSAVTRVGAETSENELLADLGNRAGAQRALFIQQTHAMRDDAGIVADTVARGMSQDADLSRLAEDLLAGLFTELSFIAVTDTDRAVIAQARLQPSERATVSGSEATSQALEGGPVPPVAVERVAGGLLLLAAAPVRASGPPTADNVRGTAVLGVRFGEADLTELSPRDGELEVLLLSTSGDVIASAAGGLEGAEVPPEVASVTSDGQGVWQGTFDAQSGRFFGAAVPLTRDDGSVPAILLVARSDAFLVSSALDVSRALFASILAATLVAVVIALWVGSRISRPVIDLTVTARRVEEGDLDAASSVGSADEIGTLARAFGSMTSTLRDTIASEQSTRRQLETIVGGMGEALVAMDADFNVVTFNPAAEAITGVSAADAIGAKCHEVYGTRTSGRGDKPICDTICPLRHGGGSDAVGIDVDGHRLTLAVTCSTLRDADGQIVGGVDLLRDVTPEAQAEKMKTNFLSNISHELRTPLTPIRGYADILRRKKVTAAQRESYLEEIVGAAGRLERIVAILVDVAAMEAGRLQVSPQPVGARDVVRAAAKRWDGRSGRHRVRSRAESSLSDLLADEALVSKALDELIDNAIKFSPDGGAVTVTARKVRGGIELAVTDKGIGVEPEQLAELFGEFVQADASSTRRFGGLGVGLAFVRRVVEGHRSTLRVQSRPGAGSTFSFVLPVSRKRRAKAAKGMTRRRGARS